jgi:hypothetical protein
VGTCEREGGRPMIELAGGLRRRRHPHAPRQPCEAAQDAFR